MGLVGRVEVYARRGRVAVTTALGVAGGVVGVFTARIPTLVDRLAMSNARMGMVLVVWGLGGLVAMPVMRVVLPRAGSAAVLRVAPLLCVLSLAVVGTAPTYGLLIAQAGLFGAAVAAAEVSAQTHGVAVERAYGRPVLGGMHAGWPVGAGMGGLLAAAGTHLGVGYVWCLVGGALAALPFALAVAAIVPRGVASGDGRAPRRTGRRRGTSRALYPLGALAFAALVLEGAVTDWSGQLMADGLLTSPALAALAYPLYHAGTLLGQIVVDPARVRFGDRAATVVSGLLSCGALLLAAGAEQAVVVLVAVFLGGVGVSPLLPIAVSRTGEVDPDGGDGAVAQVDLIGYTGLLAGPAAIGALTTIVALAPAVAVVAVLVGAVVVAVGQTLVRSRREPAGETVTLRLAHPLVVAAGRPPGAPVVDNTVVMVVGESL